MRRVWLWALGILLLVGLSGVGVWMGLPFLVDYWWYRDIGASSLLWRKFAWYGLWMVAAFWVPWVGMWLWFGVIRRRWDGRMVFLSLLLGLVSVVVVWWFRERTLALLVPPSQVKESLLHLDVMWYVSWLPFWRFVVGYGVFFFVVLKVIDAFLIAGGKRDWVGLSLLFLILFGCALLGMLFSFEIFVWQPNKRLGVGFSDFYGTLLVWWIAVGVFTGLGIFWIVLVFLGKLKLNRLLIEGGVGLILSLLVFFLWPWGLAEFYEKPNELRAQRRFIEARRIATREAFGLRYEPFVFEPTLESLAHVRVWDAIPYLQNIKQLQTIRNYFDFFDADVDFYEISNQLVQVLIACRELTLDNFLPEVKSWENMHLRYTHGFGVVVSPAEKATPEGLPIFWVRNLSLETDVPELRLSRPQIYVGESDLPYALVRTEVREFEYTDSTNRVESVYEGTNGVRLSFFRRVAFARAFGEKNIVLTRYITPQSGVLWKRRLLARLQALVPELAYDPDPYPVVVDGEIFWIVDGYTTTKRYPLAERYSSRWGIVNSIRNSVKVVVSAYTGDVIYYVVDPHDPLVAPLRFFWGRLFSDEIPEKFKKHFRYPYTLLALQAEVFGRYHMDSHESFYNGDDVWTVPVVRQGATNLPYEPLYLLLEAGGKRMAGVFVPFTPMYRQNLSGWLFGIYENGLKLYQYVSSRTESIPGPSQVEAKLYQNDELAKLFTLWGQRNAEVSLGVVRYLPLGKDVMAIVPLYLSSQYNPIPQLTLVIAWYRDRVYFGKTTGELIQALKREGGLSGE
ncbi:MAG: COG1615 family transporter [Brevinematales bacterium]|nr:COG1615 family transporter [Brevinematales bacterium]